MRTLLLASLLVAPAPRLQDVAGGGAPVQVLGAKWARSRQVVQNPNAAAPNAPAPAMIPANRNFERNRRVNDPAGVRDPNADTLDGRSTALEKNMQESRAPRAKAVDGYEFRVKVRNSAAQPAEVIFWEYRFTEKANPSNVARRQFLCGVQVRPNKEKELLAFGVSGPSDVVSAASLGEKPAAAFEEEVVINRVEYADGSIWQRRGWNFAAMKPSIERAVSTPWGAEMCRGL